MSGLDENQVSRDRSDSVQLDLRDQLSLSGSIERSYQGVVRQYKWGENSFFYNPGGALPHGVYFATLKDHDGENDSASNLDRAGIYRLSIGVGKRFYSELFGNPPTRPGKGQVIAGDFDFTQLDRLLPHPVYAWMGWVCILNPAPRQSSLLEKCLNAAYMRARESFNKKVTPP